MLVSEAYSVFCDRVLEPFGLQLGVITEADFLLYFSDVLLSFLRDTGISKIWATQAINFAVSRYTTPDQQGSADEVLVAGRFLPRSTLEQIDNSIYRWPGKLGTPKVWHEDGLPINTVELVLSPNWQGTQFISAATPACQIVTDETTGGFAGTANTDGPFVTRISGDPFDAVTINWQGKTMALAGVPFTIRNVIDADNLQLTAVVGTVSNIDWSVEFPVTIAASDRNLTTFGTRLPANEVLALGDEIPIIPDSAVLYIGWGILQKVFSSDTELRDEQKAMYCGARLAEGASIFRAFMVEGLGDDEAE